jgi:hypothetical protein
MPDAIASFTASQLTNVRFAAIGTAELIDELSDGQPFAFAENERVLIDAVHLSDTDRGGAEPFVLVEDLVDGEERASESIVDVRIPRVLIERLLGGHTAGLVSAGAGRLDVPSGDGGDDSGSVDSEPVEVQRVHLLALRAAIIPVSQSSTAVVLFSATRDAFLERRVDAFDVVVVNSRVGWHLAAFELRDGAGELQTGAVPAGLLTSADLRGEQGWVSFAGDLGLRDPRENVQRAFAQRLMRRGRPRSTPGSGSPR